MSFVYSLPFGWRATAGRQRVIWREASRNAGRQKGSRVKRAQFVPNQIMYSLRILCSLLPVLLLFALVLSYGKRRLIFLTRERDQSAMRTICCSGERRFRSFILCRPVQERASVVLMTQVNQFPVEFANISLRSSTSRAVKQSEHCVRFTGRLQSDLEFSL